MCVDGACGHFRKPRNAHEEQIQAKAKERLAAQGRTLPNEDDEPRSFPSGTGPELARYATWPEGGETKAGGMLQAAFDDTNEEFNHKIKEAVLRVQDRLQMNGRSFMSMFPFGMQRPYVVFIPDMKEDEETLAEERAEATVEYFIGEFPYRMRVTDRRRFK